LVGFWALVPIRRAVWLNGAMAQAVTEEDAGALLSPAEVARLAAVSRKTVYREVARGELKAVHVGRQLRIDPADLNQYLGRTA
jgi:excisionase family DNA binding protein